MAFPNISNRDQEHKSLTSHQEEELQTFWDTHGRFVKDHVETVKRYRETLLSPEDARLRPHEPRLQVRITGPSTVSLSSAKISISARLTCMSSQDDQALTLRNGGVFGIGWDEGEAYLFYDEQGRVPKHEFLEKEYDGEPRLVRPENGFSTLEPGETVERSVEISLFWWWRDALQLGREYDLRMPWAHVNWWRYGTMDKFQDTKVSCFDERDDGGFKITASNALRIKVVE